MILLPLFGLFGIVLSVGIALSLLSLGDFELYSFSFWIVIPAGGILLGTICTYGYFWWTVRKGIKPAWTHYLIALLMAALAFVLIQYGEYRTTYIAEGNKINHQLEGDHISNYLDEEGNVFTWKNYFVYKLKNSQSSVSLHGTEIGEIRPSVKYNSFSWVMNLIGFLLGGYFSGLSLTRRKTHCVACRQAYVKAEQALGELPLPKVVELQKEFDLEIQSNNFNAFIESVRRWDIFKNNEPDAHEETYSIHLGACPKCKQGFIIMRYFARDSEGDYKENASKKVVITVPASFTEQALNSKPA